jgi:TPR repeat protein
MRYLGASILLYHVLTSGSAYASDQGNLPEPNLADSSGQAISSVPTPDDLDQKNALNNNGKRLRKGANDVDESSLEEETPIKKMGIEEPSKLTDEALLALVKITTDNAGTYKREERKATQDKLVAYVKAHSLDHLLELRQKYPEDNYLKAVISKIIYLFDVKDPQCVHVTSQWIVFLERTAELGDLTAKKRLAHYYLHRANKSDLGDGAEIMEAMKKSLHWWRQVLENGELKTILELIDVLMNKAPDLYRWSQNCNDELVTWLRKAAEYNHQDSKWDLAYMLLRNPLCIKTKETQLEAIGLLRDIDKTERPMAKFLLAEHLLGNKLVDKTAENQQEALNHLRELVGAEFDLSASRLIWQHLLGNPLIEKTKETNEEALRRLKHAAKLECWDSTTYLVNFYERAVRNTGTLKSHEELLYWRAWKSEIMGFDESMEFLGLSHPEHDHVHVDTENLPFPEDFDEHDEHKGAGRAFALLGELEIFSQTLIQQYNPEGAFVKDPLVPCSKPLMEFWQSSYNFYAELSSCLRLVAQDFTCLIPTSKEVVDRIKLLGFPDHLIVSKLNIHDLQKPLPIRFYEIGDAYYFSFYEEAVQASDKLLRLVYFFCPASKREPFVMNSISHLTSLEGQLSVNQAMRALKAKDVTGKYEQVGYTDIEKRAAMIELEIEALNVTAPEICLLKDNSGNPTNYRFFEAEEALAQVILESIPGTRPYKYRKAINAHETGLLSNFVRE